MTKRRKFISGVKVAFHFINVIDQMYRFNIYITHYILRGSMGMQLG